MTPLHHTSACCMAHCYEDNKLWLVFYGSLNLCQDRCSQSITKLQQAKSATLQVHKAYKAPTTETHAEIISNEPGKNLIPSHAGWMEVIPASWWTSNIYLYNDNDVWNSSIIMEYHRVACIQQAFLAQLLSSSLGWCDSPATHGVCWHLVDVNIAQQPRPLLG